jgi:hypothetical protein
LFQGKEFPSGQGIYWQPTEIKGLTGGDRSELELHPLMSRNGQFVLGLRAWLYGLRFDLVAANLAPEVGSPFSADRYRPGRVQLFEYGGSLSFDWKAGPSGNEILIRNRGWAETA